jgi:hypothetical protein
MGIPELELHQLALDLHALIFEIRGGERVMRVRLRPDDERRGDSQANEVALHIVVPPSQNLPIGIQLRAGRD